MKLRVTFKTPDAVDSAIEVDDPETREMLTEFASHWVEYGEYVTIEFDTCLGIARVVLRRGCHHPRPQSVG